MKRISIAILMLIVMQTVLTYASIPLLKSTPLGYFQPSQVYAATTYHIATTGSDVGGDGSSGNP